MDLHSSSHPSPPAFQATITLAMELENKLKSETGHAFNQPQQQTRVCGTESDHHVAINGGGENEEEVDEEDDDVEKQKVNSRLTKIFAGSILTDATSPSDLKKDALNNSDVLESELMDDEDDDDSMGRSSPGSYADLSPSVDNSKEGEDLDDDFDLSVRKFGNPMIRGRLQDGSPQTFGVNGGRPDSSEGDYYDYNHMGGAESEGIGVENGNGDKFYPCHLCSFTAATKSHFNSHMNTHYNHKCNHCDYTSRTEGRLKRHMKDFHPELQSEGFSSSRILKVDRDGNHGDSNGNSQGKTKTYRCKQCSFSATVKAIFWEHTKGHIKAEKLLTCPKCPFVTEYKHHLEYHLRNHFGSKPFKCPKCNYSCVNKSMLNSHMKSHSNVYQYRCSDCTYATKYCHSLKLHLRKYTHKPAIVLNPDGTPNPIPVIDVYGTRRGPRQKKSQASDEQKRFCNGNGNSNGGGAISFSPIPMPVRAALSPATIVPYFYSGASGPLSNGFQSGMDGLLRPGNMDKSPTGASLPPPPPPPHLNNNSNHSSNGTIGTNSTVESESMENEKHHSKNTAIKCNLCPYTTEQRDSFSKHMILHAAAENQDLCSLYGINSESLMMDPTQQQQISANAMSAMAAAFGLNNNSRNDVHRQSIPVSLASTPINYDLIGHSASYRGSPNSAANNNNNYNKDKHNRIDGDGVHMNGIPPMPSSLDHLRIFSEQPNAAMYNMAREFSASHYASPNLVTYALEASPNTTDKSSTNSYSPGANSQKITSHNSKNSKEGAISTKNLSPQLSQNTASGLGPLDLSGTKNGSCVSRVSSNSSSPHSNLQQLSPHQHSPVSKTPQHVVSSGDYESLQVSTDGITCTQPPDLVSPTNPAKHRRKGKAFKLDRICMKLQKDYSYSDSPSDEMAADDSMGEYDVRSRSSDPLTNDADDDFKIIEIKEEPVDPQNESESPQLLKEVEMNGNVVNGKKSLLIGSKTLANSLKNAVDPKRVSPKYKSSNVIDLIDGDEDENELVAKNGNRWKEAFECQYCDMAFKDCIMYTVHMGYHGFKDPFKCNMCGHQANDKVAFFLHIARTAHL